MSAEEDRRSPPDQFRHVLDTHRAILDTHRAAIEARQAMFPDLRPSPPPPAPLDPDGWARPVGYAHGMAATGRVVVTAGQVGWDPATAAFTTDDFAEQTAQALRNVMAVLAAGGAGPEHLVRMTWYVTSRDEYVAARRAIGRAWREIVGERFPAMAVVIVSGLLEERAKIEIEATAVVPDRG